MSTAKKKATKRPPNKTSRGFSIYTQFTDTYGHQVRVQKSSSAFVDRCWIFVHFEDGTSHQPHPPSEGGIATPSAHLSRPQARRLAKALNRFADGKRF